MIGPAPSAEDLDALVDQLRGALASEGTAIAEVATMSVPVDVWRKAARRAGKVLGRPVRTVVHAGYAQAYLADWPDTPDEQRIHDQRLREAMTRTFPEIDEPAGRPRILRTVPNPEAGQEDGSAADFEQPRG